MAVKGDIEVELSILKTLLSEETPDKIKSKILGEIRADSFAFEETKGIYDLLYSNYIDQGKSIPSLRVVIKHPDITKQARIFLKKDKYEPLTSKTDVEESLATLSEYRKKRKLSELVMTAYEGLEGNEDSNNILEGIETRILEARSGDRKNEDIVVGGATDDDSSKKLVDKIVSKERVRLSRTGFKHLDYFLGGGCGEGDLFIITASTGGGKTAAIINMLKFIYTVNHENSVLVSLEMKNEEIGERLASILANVKYNKIRNKTFNEEEEEAIRKAWRRFDKVGKKNGCRYYFDSPTEDVDIHRVLAPLTGCGYKWVFIDYINLLSETNDKLSEAQSLSKIARYAKRWAQKNKAIVVLLSQLDEKTHTIRYSRAIKEHANTWLWWHYTDEDREKGTCTWTLGKSRGSTLGSFDMKMDLEYMRISDLEDEDNNVRETDTSFEGKDNVKKEKKKEYKSVNEDDDDF